MFSLGGINIGLVIAFAVGRVLLFTLFVYIIVRIGKKIKMNNDPALEALKLKFVNDEISKEEYQSKFEFLNSTHRKQVKHEKV